MTNKIVVLSASDSEEHAISLARHLVDEHLAACVNILPGARSIYRWQDKTEEASEFVLVIKTSRERFAALRSEIEKLHTYEVPEVIALPIVDGSEGYLGWLDRELTKTGD